MKIVYITAVELLGKAQDGGAQFSNRNIELLKSAFGEENVFICAITKDRKHLQKATGNLRVFFSNRSKPGILKNTLQGRLQFGKKVEDQVLGYLSTADFDIALIDLSRMGYLQKRLRAARPHVLQVLFMQNIEKDYIKSQMRVHPSYAVLKHAFEKNENLAIRYSDAVISLNTRDARKLQAYYGRTPDLILPITLQDRFDPSEMERINLGKRDDPGLHLLFAGSLFPPNQAGVAWFVQSVMPHVNARLTIVGKGFEKLKGELERDNVTVVGTVDDLSGYYYEADAIAAPILFGDGMKVKTAEALMYGKPLFATDEALEGYEVGGISDVFRCNDEQAFIEAINKYAGTMPHQRCSGNIRALFLEKYNTPGYVLEIKTFLQKKLDQKS